MTVRCLLLTLAVSVALQEVPERAPAQPAESSLGSEIVAIVQEHFYDAQQGRAWAQRNSGYGAAGDMEAFISDTRSRLKELQASHTGYYTPRDVEYYGLLAIFGPALKVEPVTWDSIGIDVSPEGFVRVVFAGGPAEQAHLRRGDKLLSVDGKPFHPVESFRGRSGQSLSVTFQRHAGEPVRQVTVVPRAVNPKQEWLAHQQQGTRIIERAGKTLAYVPMYACAGPEYEQALAEAIAGPLYRADALVIDFRYGWGGCNPGFVNLFNHAPPVLTFLDRDGKPRTMDGQWRKPVIVLINEGSRSGKEAVAFSLQQHGIARLVGERTAGAVLGGRCFLLSDRSILYLAVADIRVDGQRLEGQGVAPDVVVADTLAFADGTDPQLERALDLAAP
jgi:carboxyl-terminal processing protease